MQKKATDVNSNATFPPKTHDPHCGGPQSISRLPSMKKLLPTTIRWRLQKTIRHMLNIVVHEACFLPKLGGALWHG